MDNLVISHMDAKVFKHLEDYANNPIKLRAALNDYMQSLGVTPLEHTVAVLEYLFRNRTHPTAEEIFQALQPAMRTLTRNAINSTLEVLARLGAIQIIHVDIYDKRYDGDTTPHAHLICACCGEMEDLPFANNISNMLSVPRGSAVNDIQLMCLGLCAKCNQSKPVN